MNLYLIRHGEIDRIIEEDDYFYCLNEKGRKDMEDVGHFLRENEYDKYAKRLILTSETLRTLESSVILSSILETKIQMVPGCEEIRFGFNEGKERKDWVHIYRGEFTDRKGFTCQQKWETEHYQGESLKQVYERLNTLRDCILSLDDHNLYVVGHGASLRMIDMKLNNYDVDWFYNEPNPECGSVKKLVLTKDHKVISEKYIRE